MQIKVVVTVPKKIFDDKAMVAELTRVQNSKTAPEVKRLFKNTTGDWQHNVDFQSRQRTTSSSIGVSIFPTGGNAWLYAIINNGSDRHITSHTGRGMRFQTGYNASTARGRMNSKKHTRYGGWAGAQSVHQIIEPREFDKTIGDFYTGTFTRDMQKVIDYQAKKAASPSNQETLK